MAYLQATIVDYTYAQVDIKGLENTYTSYSSFKYKNETTGVTFYSAYDYYYFSNLSEGTTYTISAEACYQGTWYSCGSITFTTLYHVPPSVPSYAPVLTARGEGSLSVQWGASNDSTAYYYLRYRNYAGSTEYNMMSNTSYTLKDLEYGVTYYLSVRAKNIWKYSDYTEESTATTAPKTPTIEKVAESADTVSLKISGMTGNYDNVTVFCYDSNWNIVSTQTGSNDQTVSFSGLTQGTAYHFQAWSYLTVNGTQLKSIGYSQVDVTLNTRPQNWEWSYNISSGGNVLKTVLASNIIKAYIISVTEWISFCDRINDFRIFKGLPKYGSFPTINSEDDCTPAILNHAVWAINAMGFSIPEFTSGNVPASIFIQMRDSINSII